MTGAADIEVLAGDAEEGRRVGRRAQGPQLRRAAEAALEAAGVQDGHLAVAVVAEEEIRRLNREQRGIDEATDVLAFPVDESSPSRGPRELGDVVICPEHASDLVEAVVHGVLHLCGYDHEVDQGEMLRLQEQILAELASQRAGGDALAGS